MRTLHIDIDGVLNKADGDWSNGPAWRRDAPAFLKWALKHFDCSFLTAWYLKKNIVNKCLTPLGLRDQADEFKYPDWQHWKTEGIDFSRPFYWIDDNCMEEEFAVLEAHNVRDSLIDVTPKGEEELKITAKILARKERILYDNPIPDLSGRPPGD